MPNMKVQILKVLVEPLTERLFEKSGNSSGGFVESSIRSQNQLIPGHSGATTIIQQA